MEQELKITKEWRQNKKWKQSTKSDEGYYKGANPSSPSGVYLP